MGEGRGEREETEVGKAERVLSEWHCTWEIFSCEYQVAEGGVTKNLLRVHVEN